MRSSKTKRQPSRAPETAGPPAFFRVSFDPRSGEDGTIAARITPVGQVDALLQESGLQLSDGILDIVSDLIAELARQDVENGGSEVLD